MPNLYETLLIVTPEADDDGVNAVIGDLRTTIEADGGTVLQAGVWQRRQLAYQVQGKTEGIYVLIYADGEATLPYALKDRMKLDEAVIRSLVVRLEDQQEADVRAEIAAVDHSADEAAVEAQRIAAQRRHEAEAAAAAMSLDEIAAAADAAAETAEAAADEETAEPEEGSEAAESEGEAETASAAESEAADDTEQAERPVADETVAEVDSDADVSAAAHEEPASEEAAAGSDEAEIDEEKES